MVLPEPTKPLHRIVIACDHVGLELKNQLKAALLESGYEVADLGTDSSQRVDYPDFANVLAGQLAAGFADRGILVCGSGVGMQIAANRHPAARAAVIHDSYTARCARAHNDANIACFGSRVITGQSALSVLSVFLGTDFEGGRHAARVRKLSQPRLGGSASGTLAAQSADTAPGAARGTSGA
jgi:ribose 5-phosphate isomerase B